MSRNKIADSFLEDLRRGVVRCDIAPRISREIEQCIEFLRMKEQFFIDDESLDTYSIDNRNSIDDRKKPSSLGTIERFHQWMHEHSIERIKLDEYDDYIRKKEQDGENCFIRPVIPYYGNKFSLLKHIDALMPINFQNVYDMFGGGGTVFSNIWPLSNVKQQKRSTTNLTVNEILRPLALMHDFFLTTPPNVCVQTVKKIQNNLFEGIKRIDPSFDYTQRDSKAKLSSDQFSSLSKEAYNALLCLISSLIKELDKAIGAVQDDSASSLEALKTILDLKIQIGASYYVIFNNTLKGVVIIERNKDPDGREFRQDEDLGYSLRSDDAFSYKIKGTAEYGKFVSDLDLRRIKDYCEKAQKYKKNLKGKFCVLSESYSYIQAESLQSNDLVYLDPPYLITAARYNDFWGDSEECNLYRYIDNLHECGVKFMLSNVITHEITYQRSINKKTYYKKIKEYNSILLDWLESDLKSEKSKYLTFYMKKEYKSGRSAAALRRLDINGVPISAPVSEEILTVNYTDWQCEFEVLRHIGLELLTLEKLQEIKENATAAKKRESRSARASNNVD